MYPCILLLCRIIIEKKQLQVKIDATTVRKLTAVYRVFQVKMNVANFDACVAHVMLQSASDRSTLIATTFDDVVASILSLVSAGSEKLLP